MTERHSGYLIELLGFTESPRDRATSDLARAFGIPRDKARRLVDKAPVRVAKDIKRPQAERYVKALLSIGADVRVKGSGRERIYLAEAGILQEVVWTGSHAPIEIPDTMSDWFEPSPRPMRPPPKPTTAPQAVADQVVCPKCGLQQPPGDTCARCGIVYSKFLQRRQSDRPSADYPSTRPDPDITPVAGYEAFSSGDFPAQRESASGKLDPFIVAPEEDDRLFRQGQQVFELGRMLQVDVMTTGSMMTPGVSRAAHRAGDESAEQSPAVALRRATGRAADETRGSSDVGFWDKLGEAFAFSVSGASYQWLALMAALGAFSWLVVYLTSKSPFIMITIVGWFFVYIFFAAFLAAQWRFFGGAFAIAAANRGGEQPALTDLTDFKSEFVLPGELLSLGAAILWSPFIYTIIKALSSGTPASEMQLFLFALLPLIYWPMGMAYVTTSGRLTEVFIVTGVVKGMVIGGLEYVFVAILGVAAFFVVGYLMSFSNQLLHYHWALLYALLGYVSGVQGYLLGKLVRRRPEMIEGIEAVESE